MEKEQKLSTMESKGYSINITLDGESKKVDFTGMFSREPYQVKHCYDKSWTDYEIRLDLIDDLIRWAGYRIVERLEPNV